MDEKRIQELMTTLDISRDEAIQVLKDDDAIEHGEKLFELTPEQKKAEKKARKTGTRTVYNFTKRERKPNEEKSAIIQKLAENLQEWEIFGEDFAKSVQIVKKEREITFKVGENDYSLTLICHRKPKNK